MWLAHWLFVICKMPAVRFLGGGGGNLKSCFWCVQNDSVCQKSGHCFWNISSFCICNRNRENYISADHRIHHDMITIYYIHTNKILWKILPRNVKQKSHKYVLLQSLMKYHKTNYLKKLTHKKYYHKWIVILKSYKKTIYAYSVLNI